MAEIDWWRRIQDILQTEQNPSEEATKQRVIEPTLAYLGWDVFGSDVVREYTVQSHGGKDAVDYALTVEDIPKVLIEAKKLANPLGDREARQVLGYARIERVQWCVLTNGRTWRVFNANWGKSPEESLFREWEFNPGPSFPDAVLILSKESVATGKLDREAGESRANQRLLNLFQRELPAVRETGAQAARKILLAAARQEFPGLTRAEVDAFVRERLQVSIRSAGPGQPPPAPPPPRQDFPVIPMTSLADEEVVVFPSKPPGVEFLRKYRAWGYVKLSRLPPYLALYVSGGIGRIRYLGRTIEIVEPDDPKSPVKEDHARYISYEPGKKLVLLDPNAIWRLEREIPMGANKSALRTHRFFSLTSFKTARTVDDLR